jgi:uncharacterized protein GlcG (DUF336 family)
MSARRVTPPFVLSLAVAVVALGGCDGSNFTSAPVTVDFGGPADPLTDAEAFRIVQRAVFSIDAADFHVAVTDRTGDIVAAYSTIATGPGDVDDADNIAVSLARTTSFFSNSQAPLSSRTVETLSTFHFPPTFASEFIPSRVPASGAGPVPEAVIAPTRRTSGIAGTPQGPLWQINATNRGAAIETGLTTPPTLFNSTLGSQPAGPPGEPVTDPFPLNVFYNPARNLDGTLTSPGITLLPGAVPLYKVNAGGVPRLVGGVGVYIRDAGGDPLVDAAEFAAIQGARGTGAAGDENFFFDAIPLEGAITIVGILLPYVKQTSLPAGFAPRGGAVAPGDFLRAPVAGRPDPFGYLIGPRAAVNGTNGQALDQADVERIIAQCVDSANLTRAQVRLPLGSPAKIIATVVDTRGLILAHYRMEDTLCDAIDVVPAKARSVVYYCKPSSDPTSAFANGDTWPDFPTGDPRGIALTTRTLGFVSQPFYPPGIGGTFSQAEFLAAGPAFVPAVGNTAPGPLYGLALQNQLPEQFDRWGNSPPDPGYQNGLTFFPGSVPLYKNGELVGALGVSGDGVEQNDLIAFDGGAGFEPPPELRIDNFSFAGVRLPYLKFPETPR